MRIKTTLTALALAALGMGGAAAQDCPQGLDLVTPGKLTMSINLTIPPRQYIDERGRPRGLNVELGEEIARRLCLEPEYMNVGFEVQIPGLANKRWDMVNTGMYYTPERSKIMQMVPYVVNALAIIVERGNPLGVTGYDELAGHPVGSEIAGFADKLLREMNDEQVAKGFAPMDVRAFNTFAEAFAALGAGQVRAVFGPDATAVYYAQRGAFEIGANGLNPGLPSSFGFDAANVGLAEAVRDALAAMAADGTYGRMMAEYGAAEIELWDMYDGDFRVMHDPS